MDPQQVNIMEDSFDVEPEDQYLDEYLDGEEDQDQEATEEGRQDQASLYEEEEEVDEDFEEEMVEAECDENTDVSPASVDITEETIISNKGGIITESVPQESAITDSYTDVVVEVDEPDQVVGMMIEKLTSTFPPETVVTVSSGFARGGNFVGHEYLSAGEAINHSGSQFHSTGQVIDSSARFHSGGQVIDSSARYLSTGQNINHSAGQVIDSSARYLSTGQNINHSAGHVTTTKTERALMRPVSTSGQTVNVHTSVMPGNADWQSRHQSQVISQGHQSQVISQGHQSQVISQGQSSGLKQTITSGHQQQHLGGNIYMSVTGGSGQTFERVETVTGGQSYGGRVETVTVGQTNDRVDAVESKRLHSSTSIAGESVVSQRIISSTVLNEEAISAPSEEKVTYIEVPVVEIKEVFVTKKEIVEVEKRVPKIEIEYVDRVVEVPQIEYVEKIVEVPRIQEVIRNVPIKKIVDRPYDVVRHVPIIETKIVERIVEIPEIIERAVPQIIEQKVEVLRYHDKEVASIVAQTINSVVKDSGTSHPVDANKYEPRLVAVDVFVPLPVQMGGFVGIKKMDEKHQLVEVPAAHYNSLVTKLNSHIEVREHQTCLPLLQQHTGQIPFLPVGESIDIVQPVSSEWQAAYASNKVYCSEMTTHTVINKTGETSSKFTQGQRGQISSSATKTEGYNSSGVYTTSAGYSTSTGFPTASGVYTTSAGYSTSPGFPTALSGIAARSSSTTGVPTYISAAQGSLNCRSTSENDQNKFQKSANYPTSNSGKPFPTMNSGNYTKTTNPQFSR